jgi:hypothetical protein
MSKSANTRKAIQTMTVRATLAKYLSGQDLEHAVRDMQDAMRVGPQAWAFKRAGEDEIKDDRTYYTAGGAAI